MEITSLNVLKNDIEKLLVLYRSVSAERDDLANKLSDAESELEMLKTQTNDILHEESGNNGGFPELEEKVREKIDELLAILDNL